MTLWTADNKALIEAQLKRMSESAIFAHAGRMFPLLRYLVDAELSGTADRLNQHRIAIDALGRDERFDPATDSIVRVEAGRLRSKLREFYATVGANDPVVLDLPKGGYSPTIQIQNRTTVAAKPAAPKQDIRFCQTNDGTNIAYSVSGQGYPMVKAANWLSHLEYDYHIPLWRHWWTGLSQRFRLIRYDERGCGLSDWDLKDFSFEAWVQDLEQVINVVGVEKFALLGVSQGASVAIAYAARYPERVSHLILYGSFAQGGFKRPEPKAAEQSRMLLEIVRVGWGQEHAAFRNVFGTLLMPDGNTEQFKWFDELQRVSTSAKNAEKFLQIFENIDVVDIAAQVRVPTLVMHAKDEIGIPFAQARLMAARIPNAKLVPIDSSNHIILEHEAAWQLFLDEVDEFVNP